jgi:hypothetical protein
VRLQTESEDRYSMEQQRDRLAKERDKAVLEATSAQEFAQQRERLIVNEWATVAIKANDALSV